MIDHLFRLSRREYFADFFITPPITAVLMIISLANTDSLMTWTAWFIAGLVAWSLYEYVTHRWVSHEFWIFRDAHMMHHHRPADYIAVHPGLTLSLYALFWLLFGFNSSAAMVGFSIGYIAYSVVHTAFHYGRIRKGRALYVAKRRHDLHHVRAWVNFGVTTPFWDHVFRTYRAPRL